MTILITADNSFICIDNKQPEVGRKYNLEDATKGTEAQNRYFHKIVLLYFNSGCYSDDVTTADELKQELKKRIGLGYVNYNYVSTGDIPEWKRGNPEDSKYNKTLLASWSHYTKKERRMMIDNLIKEMITAGVDGKDFEEMIANSGQLFSA